MHFNENSERQQAKTIEGVPRWVVIYPKAHKGEKAIARQIKQNPTYSKSNEKNINVNFVWKPDYKSVINLHRPISSDVLEYIQTIHCETIKLRKEFGNIQRAKNHAKEFLPKEPISLVQKYLDGNQPQSKAEVVAKRYSRFTKPAYPVQDECLCECSGKCATRRCWCKKNAQKCTATCRCKKDVCSNK